MRSHVIISLWLMLFVLNWSSEATAIAKDQKDKKEKCTKSCAPVPFQFGASVTIPSDQLGGATSFVVPADKLLKVEDVTIQSFHTGEGDVVQCSVSTQIDADPSVGHGLQVVPQGAAGGFAKSYTCNRMTSFYASGGTTVTLGVARQFGGSGSFTVGVSGTLYDD